MKKFSLIELIVVIAILAVLSSFIIPNLSNQKPSAIANVIQQNINILQLASDTYYLDHGQYPTYLQPTLQKPELINFELLYPNYIKSFPFKDTMPEQNYWVSSDGRVYGATIDAPSNIIQMDNYLEWEHNQNVTYYKIYKTKNQTTSSLKNVSLFQQLKPSNAYDKINVQLENVNADEILISAVDTYGLETAPFAIDYEGLSEFQDFKPIVQRTGEFYFNIGATRTMYWKSFKVNEHKPEGTNIEYYFAVGDNKSTLGEYTDDFSSLEPAKFLSVKVVMTSTGTAYPSLYDMRVTYTFAENDAIISSRVSAASNTIVDQVKLGAGEYISVIKYTDYVQYGDKVRTHYQYSHTENGNYVPVNSLSEIPPGTYVRIIRIVERVGGGDPADDYRSPFVYTTKKPPAVQYVVADGTKKDTGDKGNTDPYITLQTLSLYASTEDGNKTHWLSAEIEDYQPENTRILYRYSYSNDGRFVGNYENISSVPASRMLKVTAQLQIKKSHKDQSEHPAVYGIAINHSGGIMNLNTLKPTGSIVIHKSNNQNTDTISTATIIEWDYEAFDPSGDEIIEAQWGGDKREQYETPGTYAVTLRLKNSKNIWSDTITYKFNVFAEKPVAVITSDKDVFASTEAVDISYADSYDPDGDGIKQVEWGGDYRADGNYPIGIYTITLRVQDAEGNWSDWVSKQITVSKYTTKTVFSLTTDDFIGPYGGWYQCGNKMWSNQNGIFFDVQSGCAKEYRHNNTFYYDNTKELHVQTRFQLNVDYYGEINIGFIKIEDGRHTGVVRGRIRFDGQTVYTNQTQVKGLNTWDFYIFPDKTYKILVNGSQVKQGTLNKLPNSGDYNLHVIANKTSGTHNIRSVMIEQ